MLLNHAVSRPMQVCAVTQGGAFAEEVVVPAAAAWHIPGDTAAASMACVGSAAGSTAQPRMS
jgi:D-arabinose 1-dehydrogenase-like Zn-dependent alcohol dehydrogenase